MAIKTQKLLYLRAYLTFLGWNLHGVYVALLEHDISI